MNVLIVTQYFWPENFKINDLASELVKRGHNVTVLTGVPNYPDGFVFQEFLNNPAYFRHYEGAEIVRVSLFPRGSSRTHLILNYLSFVFSASFQGLWKLRGRQFDVVFANQLSPVTIGIPAAVISFFKRAPLVLWVQDLWPESLHATGVVRSRTMLWIIGKLVSLIYNRCDLILAQSKSFIIDIHKYAGRHARVLYFPNWAESIYEISHAISAPEVPLKPESFDIVFAGNIGEAQDFSAILSAAEILKFESKIRWLIIGGGRRVDWVSSEIKKRDLHNCVLMLGRYPVDRMPSFFKHAKVLLVSLKDEPIFSMTIPSKLQTYLAAGKPVLGMINGEGAMVIKESGSGVVCSAGNATALADSVLKLSAMSTEELEDMGRKGLEYSKREFDRSNLISKLEMMFKQLKIANNSNGK